jgi:hypothetical protein
MISFSLIIFIAFQPHSMVMFCLNSPLLFVSMVIMIRCKEWTRNVMAMCGARLRQLTSITISTLLGNGSKAITQYPIRVR